MVFKDDVVSVGFRDDFALTVVVTGFVVDLVDYSSIPDHSVTPPYKYVLTVQDHLTKFVHLRPCQSKEGVEVAKHLYLIFCEFGAPLLLQSDNGLELRNQVVAGLKILWHFIK